MRAIRRNGSVRGGCHLVSAIKTTLRNVVWKMIPSQYKINSGMCWLSKYNSPILNDNSLSKKKHIYNIKHRSLLCVRQKFIKNIMRFTSDFFLLPFSIRKISSFEVDEWRRRKGREIRLDELNWTFGMWQQAIFNLDWKKQSVQRTSQPCFVVKLKIIFARWQSGSYFNMAVCSKSYQKYLSVMILSTLSSAHYKISLFFTK